MQITINIPRNIARYNTPDLFEVYVHDYDDGYHQDTKSVDPELEQAARSISSRPRRLSEYYDSMRIYHDYMDALAAIHGGKKILKMKIRDEVIKEFIPAKPRLKNKSLRKLAKRGIIISEPRTRHLDFDAIGEWAEENLLPDDYMEREIEPIERVEKPSKDIVKAYRAGMSTSRRYKRGSYGSEIDYMSEYFSMRNAMSKTTRKKKGKKDGTEDIHRRRIVDYLYGDYEKRTQPEESNNTIAQYNGILLSAENAETLALYHKLGELGWDSYALMKRANFNKRTLSKFKKFKRTKKKDKKKNKKSQECTVEIGTSFGSFMNDIAEENGYDDYEEFSIDMLDASWDNIQAQCRGRV